MKTKDYTRANPFDRICGFYQTQKVIDIGAGNSILDIGCGWGEFTQIFTKRFDRIVGLDPEPELLEIGRKESPDIEYVEGWGETFKLDEKFDTISMNNLLEHVDDPVALLKNCKKHLAKNGVIIGQTPNAASDTRRLGLLMGAIDDIKHMTKKEQEVYGHQRSYLLTELEEDFRKAGLEIVNSGTLIFKPLPNDFLMDICRKQGDDWAMKFVRALYDYKSEDRGGYLYVCAK